MFLSINFKFKSIFCVFVFFIIPFIMFKLHIELIFIYIFDIITSKLSRTIQCIGKTPQKGLLK